MDVDRTTVCEGVRRTHVHAKCVVGARDIEGAGVNEWRREIGRRTCDPIAVGSSGCGAYLEIAIVAKSNDLSRRVEAIGLPVDRDAAHIDPLAVDYEAAV